MADKRGKLKIGSDNFYPAPFFPIGSVYISVVNTNPSTWFGGTWVQFGQGKTLVGVNTSDTDFKTVKKTGGSKSLQKHNHSLKGNSSFPMVTSSYSGVQGWNICSDTAAGCNGGMLIDTTVSDAGTGNSGNLQPYITVYFWERTA